MMTSNDDASKSSISMPKTYYDHQTPRERERYNWKASRNREVDSRYQLNLKN